MSDTPPKDPPIEPAEYLRGLTVIDFGDLRVARGLSRRPFSACRHFKLNYDQQERRIWCRDCETNVEPFDAFTILCENYSAAARELRKREDALKVAENEGLISLAARVLDKIWRGRNKAPMCPSCSRGLLPEDFKNGCAWISADLERKRRESMNDPAKR